MKPGEIYTNKAKYMRNGRKLQLMSNTKIMRDDCKSQADLLEHSSSK